MKESPHKKWVEELYNVIEEVSNAIGFEMEAFVKKSDKEGFIATYMDENENIYYYGQNKPSVDTPIQLRLYKILPDVNYMLHAHVYIKDAPFTKTPIPCGGLEEVEEIMKALKKIGKTSNISINLIGHGSIILAKDLSYMKDINYIQRPIPEILDKTK